MTVTTLPKGLRRVIRVIFLILVTVILQNSSGGVFSKTPQVTARWEIPSSNNSYHLGEVIKATLYVSTQPGTTVDLEKLPAADDILTLPDKLDGSIGDYRNYDMPPMIEEGDLEIISRQISQYAQGGLVITRIDYELMYLLPIDPISSADDKQLPYNVPIYQKYRQFYPGAGKVELVSTMIFVDMADFFIVPRVDKNSQPFIEFFKLTPPRSAGPQVRLAGFAMIGLAVGILAWRGLRNLITSHRQQDESTVSTPDATKLYQAWCENPDPAIFIEALKLYRRGIWGHPKASTWFATTFILYSGVSLGYEQMKTVFDRLIKEVSNVPSP